MPTQPAWYHRLNDILAELEGLRVGHLDRLAVEKLFEVRERRARQLMSGLPGLRVGNAIAVERVALIRFLESVAKGEKFQWEVGRRGRVVEELERTRRQLSGRRVSIPAEAVRGLEFSEGIDLRKGELRISFAGAEDLAGKLFEVSQAMTRDWEGFKEAASK